MARNSILGVLGVLGICLLAGQGASAKNLAQVDVKPNAAKRFARLPVEVQHPEGLTINPNTRELTLGTFNLDGDNFLVRLRRNGRVDVMLPMGTTPLLGVVYNPLDDMIYFANFGAGEIQRVPAEFDETSTPETVASVPLLAAPPVRVVDNPDGVSTDTITFGAPAIAAPNGLAIDAAGTLHFSDSFQGAIFSIVDAANCALPCPVDTLVQDALLATAGSPGFGANGIAFNPDETLLYVANTGDDRLLTVDVATGEVLVLVDGINGADGVLVDGKGNIWVVANQSDEVVVFDRDGDIRARLGAFHAVRRNGEVRGLLFPASIAQFRRNVFVTNLALPLTAGEPGLDDDEPEDLVSRFTIARIGSHKYSRRDLDDDDDSSDDDSSDSSDDDSKDKKKDK